MIAGNNRKPQFRKFVVVDYALVDDEDAVVPSRLFFDGRGYSMFGMDLNLYDFIIGSLNA